MLPTRYVFNHFRKTGGTSLVAVCRLNLEPGEISPHLDDHLIRQKPSAQLEQYRLITGHFSLTTQLGFCQSRFRVTLLRDPIRRIFSAYTFFRTVTEQNVFAAKSREMSFAETVRYFRDSPIVIHNPYTYHFACIDKDCTGFPADTKTLMDTAKHNLAAFDFVGIAEELGRSTRLLCRQLGWHAPETMPHENRSWSETTFDEIDSETMRILRQRNELDYELYDYAVELFRGREAAANVDGSVPSAKPMGRPTIVPLAQPLTPARRAAFTSVAANWFPSEDARYLEIMVRFLTAERLPEETLGLLITDSVGNIVWGTNTRNDGLPLELQPCEENCAAFLLECQLPPGTYFITVALSEGRRLGFHDHWIDRAEIFRVAEEMAVPEGRPYFVRLREYWSGAVEKSGSWGTPWRNPALHDEPDAEQAGVRRLADGSAVCQLQVTNSPDRSTLHPAFRPFGYFDVNAAISRPLVRLHLADSRVEVLSRDRWQLRVAVTNLGDQILSTRYEHPVKASYHWMADEHTIIIRDGLRSNLNFDVLPGDTCLVEFVIQPPPNERCKLLCLTLVQELVCWFDDRDPGNRLLVIVHGATASAV